MSSRYPSPHGFMLACTALLLSTLSCRRKPAGPQVTAEPYTPSTAAVTPGGTIDETVTTPFPRPLPFPVSPVVVGGSYHTCVLDTHGLASCFGRNDEGQLGDGTTTDHPLDPVRVKLDELVQIGAGNDFTCGLRRDRSVWCWGYGVWSIFPGSASHPAPTRIEGFLPANRLEVTWGSACVATEKEVYCWGSSQFGQVGAPPFHLDSTPRAMGVGAALALGNLHVGGIPVLRANGLVEDPLAVPPDAVVLSSQETRGSTRRVMAVRGRPQSLWTVLEDGTLHHDMILSAETHKSKDHDRRIHRVMALPPVRSLSTDPYPFCAVVTDGRVFCWGDNDKGQLGDGTTVSREEAGAVVGLNDAIASGGSFTHQCAITRTHEVQCWGTGFDGNEGGTGLPTRKSLKPTRVATF
ncbi:MAG: hypothetical protein NVS3B10_07780 [Polyangiales bacterium]